ncbi:hypothetical protein [Pseudomonas serbica]
MVHVEDEKKTAPGVYSDPMDFLLAVMNDQSVKIADRLDAAADLMPYFHDFLDDL